MSQDALELLGIFSAISAAHKSGMLQLDHGIVEKWDPDAGTVTVLIKPYNQLSPDMPLLTYAQGAQSPPTKGDPMLVLRLELDFLPQDLYYAIGTFNNDRFKSPGAASGEHWITHVASKAAMKLLNDKRALITSTESIDLSTDEDALVAHDAIVRKADLQVLIDELNNLLTVLKEPTVYLGNLGGPLAPTLINTVGAFSAATASSIAKAKG